MTASVLTRSTRVLPAGARLIALGPEAAYAVRVLAAAEGGAALGTLAADGEDPSEHISRQAAELANRLVAHVLGTDDDTAGSDLRVPAERLERLLDQVRRTIPAGAAELMPAIQNPPLPLAEDVLRQTALERHGHALMLLSHPTYELVVGVRALHRAEVLARTAERVLLAAEDWVPHDELLETELEAAYWFGERCMAADDGEGERGGRSVTRRMEWALAERATLESGQPVLASLLRAEGEDWPAARRRAAESLLASRADAWHVVMRVDEETAEARSLTGGDIVRVHDPDGEAEPGRVILGRLLPCDGGEYVVAHSTELVADTGEADLHALASDVRAFADSGRLPLALALEATIADGLYGARIPRAVAPAQDREGALLRIAEVEELLLRRGVARRLEDVPARSRPALPPGTSLDRLALPDDPVLAAWLTALVAVAQPPAPAREPSGDVRRLAS